MRSFIVPSGALVLAVTACTAHSPALPTVPSTSASVAPHTVPQQSKHLDFAGLVREAVQFDGRSGAEELRDCTVHQYDDHSLMLTGDVIGAVRPLPMPALDLDADLAQSVTVNVLTPFGRYGDAAGALTLASFSYAPPTAHAVAIILTDRGAYVRGTNAMIPAVSGVAPRDAANNVRQLDRTYTVFVAAEAEVPTGALIEALIPLADSHVPTALAVNLAQNTALPSAPPEVAPPLCPDGLGETSDAEGDLAADSMKSALAQLRDRAADCLDGADTVGAAGGRARLALRVAASGQVAEACLIAEETGDARLRTCLVREAKALRFPQPQPAGSVDIELPMTLKSRRPPAPRAICTVERML